MSGYMHYLICSILYGIVWYIMTRQTKREKKRMKKISHNKELKFYSDLLGCVLAGGYFIVFMYSIALLPSEHDGFKFLFRMAVFGSIVSCLFEIILFIISKTLKISTSDIILSAAYIGHFSTWVVHFFRIIGPILLLIYGFMFLFNN